MLIDTYAWIEFFQGSNKGYKVKDFLESTECFTSIVSISEITEWCFRNRLIVAKFIKIIEESSVVLNLNKEIVKLAGKINFENKKLIKNWGMLDSLIYSTARIYNLRTLTGDRHFENLTDVEML